MLMVSGHKFTLKLYVRGSKIAIEQGEKVKCALFIHSEMCSIEWRASIKRFDTL